MATVQSLPTAVVVMAVMVMSWAPAVTAAPRSCYSYHDHAAQYQLDPYANNYPWQEVEYMMKQNPYLSDILAKGTRVPTSRPPDQHYHQPVSVVCPSNRFMLKAFTVDNKQCWVIKPQVQQLRYTRCSDKYNRDCHYCRFIKGGMSKCEEDYEWQTVWAYCRSIPQPHPYPHHTGPNRHPWQSPNEPTLGNTLAEPNPYPHEGLLKVYPTKLYAKRSDNSYANRRWKRSPSLSTRVEKISLYLPYQCSCKTFRC